MVVNSWSDHQGNWRGTEFSSDTPPKISKICHRVTVVGVQRSIQLSYDRTYVKNVAGANSFDEMQRPGVKGPCAARNLFSIAHPPGKCNPRRGVRAGVQTFVLSFIGSAK